MVVFNDFRFIEDGVVGGGGGACRAFGAMKQLSQRLKCAVTNIRSINNHFHFLSSGLFSRPCRGVQKLAGHVT